MSRIHQPALNQKRKRILRIALEPRVRRAETKRVAPRIHVDHQARASDAMQVVGEQDLQCAGRVFLGDGIAGIGVDRAGSGAS